MKKLKKFRAVLVLICLIAVGMSDAGLAAAKEGPPAPTSGTASTDPDYGETIKIVNPLTTKYIKDWNIYIKKISDNYIKIGGYTASYSASDSIGLKLFLQSWNESSSQWEDIDGKEWVASSSDYVSGAREYDVESGYYYRVRGVHYVLESGTKEQVEDISGYLYID